MSPRQEIFIFRGSEMPFLSLFREHFHQYIRQNKEKHWVFGNLCCLCVNLWDNWSDWLRDYQPSRFYLLKTTFANNVSLRRRQFSLGLVHTNPFSNKNGVVLLRIRLSSTLQRRKRSPNTEPFEAIWKRYFLKTLFSSVDGENDARLSENGDVIK